MLKHLAVIVALFVAGVFFCWVGKYAGELGVDRSVEKHLFYQIGGKLADGSGKYVVPVLFPLDLIVMLLLSGSLAWASASWGPQGLGGSPCYYLILPLAYLAFDLAEDSLLVLLLQEYVSVSPAIKIVLQGLTAGKMATLVLAGIQTVVAGGAALCRGLSA